MLLAVVMGACSPMTSAAPLESQAASGAPLESPIASATATSTPMATPSEGPSATPGIAVMPDLAVFVGRWQAKGRTGAAIVIYSLGQERLDGGIVTAYDGSFVALPCTRTVRAVQVSALRVGDGTFRLGPYSASHKIDTSQAAAWSLTLSAVDAATVSGSFRIVRGTCDTAAVPWSAAFVGTGAGALQPGADVDPRSVERIRDLLRCWSKPGCQD